MTLENRQAAHALFFKKEKKEKRKWKAIKFIM